MLIVNFSGEPGSKVILADSPHQGKEGIIECSICSEREWLSEGNEDLIASEIETFIKEHRCLELSRKREVDHLVGLLQSRGAGISIRRGD